MDSVDVSDILLPLYSIFENGYKLGQGIWMILNSPLSDLFGEDVGVLGAVLPGFLADATLLEACFGPILFATILYKIVASFVPL